MFAEILSFIAHRKFRTMAVTSIADPSAELNLEQGHEKGDLMLVYQTAATKDDMTLYSWDDADSGAENVPYSVDGATGIWMAIAGKYSYWASTLPMYAYAIDGAGKTSAAVTAVVNAYSGVIATTTQAGTTQVIGAPTDTTSGKRFWVVNNDTSTQTFEVTGSATITVDVGSAEQFMWDGSAWIHVTTADASEITFNPASVYLANTNVQDLLDALIPATAGTVEASKALVVDASRNIATIGAITADGNIIFDGGTFSFNSSLADKDFTVGAVGAANALFVQGSDGKVAIGTTTPHTTLYVGKDGTSNQLITIHSDSDVDNTYAGILFRTAGTATDAYAKAGIFFEKTAASYNRGKLHFAVDGAADAGNAVIADARVTIDYVSGYTGFGTVSPDRLFHAEVSDAVTNAVTYGQRLSHISSATVVAGFGVGQEYELEENDGTNKVAGIVECLWTDAGAVTNADADFVWKLMLSDATAAEKMRLTSAGNLTFAQATTISTTAGALNLTPAAGSAVVLDGHWNFDGNALTSLTDNNTTLTAYAGKAVVIESVSVDGGAVTGVTTLQTSGTVGIGVAPNTGLNLYIDADIAGGGKRDIVLGSTFTFTGNSQTNRGISIENVFTDPVPSFTGTSATALYINPTYTNVDIPYSIWVDNTEPSRFDGDIGLTGSRVPNVYATNVNSTTLTDGTASITAGAVTGVTTLSMNNQLTNTLATGTSPFAITSMTVNTNLNADLLDGEHASAFQDVDATLTALAGLSTGASELIYSTGADAFSMLAANATATNKFLRQVSSGAPSWETLGAGDIPDLSATYQPLDANLTSLAGLSHAIGDLIYATAATTYASLADVAVGSVLVSGGIGVAPAYSSTPSVTSITAGGAAFTGGTNTFDITNGTASFNVAAGAAIDLNYSLTVGGDNAVVINSYDQANTVILYQDLTIGSNAAGQYGISLFSEDAAGTITLDQANFEVEGITSNNLMKLVNPNNAAATLTINGTAGAVNQDVQSTASPQFASIGLGAAAAANQTILAVLDADDKIYINATSTGHTDTAGILDIDVTFAAAATGVVGIDMHLNSPTAGITDATTHYGLNVQFTGDDNDNAGSIVQLIQVGYTPNGAPAGQSVYGLYTNDSDLTYFIFNDNTAVSRFDGNIMLNDGVALVTGVVDDDYVSFKAVENTGNTLEEVARLSGAVEPRLTFIAPPNLGAVQTQEIGVGVIGLPSGYVAVFDEGGPGAGADDLVTMTGGREGDLVILKIHTGSSAITVTDGGGANGFILAGGANFVMDHVDDRLMVLFNGTAWVEVSRSDNS